MLASLFATSNGLVFGMARSDGEARRELSVEGPFDTAHHAAVVAIAIREAAPGISFAALAQLLSWIAIGRPFSVKIVDGEIEHELARTGRAGNSHAR